MLLLTIDLVLAFRGVGLVRSRRAALILLGLLVLGNLGGGELLLTAFMIWGTDVIVVGARRGPRS